MSALSTSYYGTTITKPSRTKMWNSSSLLTDESIKGKKSDVEHFKLGPVLNLLCRDQVFMELTNRLFALSTEEEENEPPASSESIGTAISLLATAYEFLGRDWIDPFLTADGFGGLRMTWAARGQEVRAIVPRVSSKKRYLYIEEGKRYESISGFTDLTLASILQRLLAKQEGSIFDAA